MDKDSNIIANMNKFLLNNKKTTINLTKLNQNIEDLYVTLYQLDPEKEPHKYLCLSCIFGAFMGDSIGSCCEFSYENPKNHLNIFKYENGIFRPGEVTDDSEMAMSAAFAYIDIINENPDIIQNLLYYYYGIWRCSGPKDIGGATTSALRFFFGEESILKTKFSNKIVKQTNWDSLANGFLMRISTFITYYYYTHIKIIYDTIKKYFDKDNSNDDLPDEILNLYLDIFKESYKNVEITHPNYENGISSAVFTLMTYVGMVTKDARKVFQIFNHISKSKKFLESHEEKSIKFYAGLVQDKYVKIISDITSNKHFSVYNQMGYYLHGFKLSVYFLHKYPEMGENKDDDLYYKIMCEVCDKGGDTDTNCAIVGAMIGPLIGYKNFKEDLFERFIRFVPDKRCQYNSAFMYVYVKYLEEKLLNNQSNNENNEKNETKVEEKKEAEDNQKPLDLKEKKEEQTQENKTEENPKSSDLKDKNEEQTQENKTEENTKPTDMEDKNEEQSQQNKIEDNNKILEVKKEDDKKIENKTQEQKSVKKEEGFKYTAYKLIVQFLNESMEL